MALWLALGFLAVLLVPMTTGFSHPLPSPPAAEKYHPHPPSSSGFIGLAKVRVVTFGFRPVVFFVGLCPCPFSDISPRCDTGCVVCVVVFVPSSLHVPFGFLDVQSEACSFWRFGWLWVFVLLLESIWFCGVWLVAGFELLGGFVMLGGGWALGFWLAF